MFNCISFSKIGVCAVEKIMISREIEPDPCSPVKVDPVIVAQNGYFLQHSVGVFVHRSVDGHARGWVGLVVDFLSIGSLFENPLVVSPGLFCLRRVNWGLLVEYSVMQILTDCRRMQSFKRYSKVAEVAERWIEIDSA